MNIISKSWLFKSAFIGFLIVFIQHQVNSQSISNYTFSASSGTFSPLSGGTIPPGTGTGTVDEGIWNAIPIGFDFWYMGIHYTTVSASTNGWLTLGANIINPTPGNNLSGGGSPRPILAPLWDDLNIQAGTNAVYLTSGNAGSRVFTLQFLNHKWNNAASGNTISFQVKLYQTTGKIEFIYRQETGAVNVGSASIGIAATGTGSGNFRSLSGTGTNPSVSSTAETANISAKPASGQIYAFTPLIPTAPTNLAFSNVTNSSITLSWADNSTNETGFVIYRSTDGTNYSFDRQTAANSTSAVVSGLSYNTTYYWRIYSVSVGAFSSNFASGSQATLCMVPAAPTVTSTYTYCQNEIAGPLTASGTNLIWGGGLVSGFAGGTSPLTTTTYVDSQSANNNKKTNFSTGSDNVIINSVDYYIPANQTVNNLVLAIYNSAGTIISSSSTTTTQTAGNTAIKITNTFNYTIPAAGNYSIGVLSGLGNIGSDNPAYPITEPTGTINVTGVSVTGLRCYNNIRFSANSGSSTAPTPSTSQVGSTVYTVTQTVNGCISPPASITVNITALNISQTPTSGLIGDYNFTGNAVDETGTNNGVLQNNPTPTPDRYNSSNSAYTFNGSNNFVSTTNSYANPANFTISLWFKTNNTTGGKLIGFGNSQTGQSGNYDRHIYMNNAGQVYFGVYPGTVITINSPLSYNDNQWHNVTASLSSTSGMSLYVDGQVVATNSAVTTAENFTGYWKIGGDNMNGWTSQPTNYYFNGILDDALIYNRALSQSEVNTLYSNPDGAGNNGPVCAGSALILSGKTVSGATYSWSGPNGFASTLQNPTLTYTAANAGIYTLWITVAGCTGTAFTTVASSQNSGQWTGNVSSDWSNPNNWCNGVVPASTTDVIIPSTAVRMPLISNSVNSNHLTINSGATLTTTVGGTLNIGGNLTNNGSITNSGTTNFNGTSGQQTFSGVATFHNLSITNASGLSLPNAITVNSDLLFSSGNLFSNNFNIDIKGNWTNNSGANSFSQGSGTTTFNGPASQAIGGTFATNFNNLIIVSTGGVTLTNNTQISGNLTVSVGIFNLSTFTSNRTTTGGILTVSNSATLKIGGANTYPVNYSTNTLVVASTVEYSGTNQAVANQSYGNLVFSSSGGAAIKTMPGSALTVVGNLSSIVGAGTSVTFTPNADVTINGSVSIGTSTVFNGGSFSHIIGGNWGNNGTFNGNTSNIIFSGSGTSVGGSGVQNFNNLTVAASLVNFAAVNMTLTGNLATTGSGSFSQANGGTLFMTGTGKTISGPGIVLHNLTVSGSVSTSPNLNLSGDLSVSGSLTTGPGIFAMSGSAKTISGTGTINFGTLSIPGSVTTNSNFSITSGLSVNGSLSASAGTVTFSGMTFLNGNANLFNANINGTSLQLSTNSILGVASSLTIASGKLDVTTAFPNTVNFNGNLSQNINPITYSHLVLSNGNTKTASGNITTTHDLTIGAGTVFNASSFTHSIFGNWINVGTLTAGTSTVQFLGPKTASITGATTFNILTSNTTSTTTELILQNNVSAEVVNMNQGIISTGSNTLTITGTRTGVGYIFGNIRRNHVFTTGTAYAFEGPENTITFSDVSSVNSITVSVVNGSVSDFPFGGSLSREYAILVPAGTYTGTLRLHYEDEELNGNSEGSMGLWRYNGSVWVAVGKTGNNATTNYVEQSGLTNITNRWTFSDQSNVVQWNGSVSSDWNTAANWTVLQGSASRPPSATDIVNLGTAAFSNHPTISNSVQVKNIVFGSVQALNLSMADGGSLTSGDIKGVWNSSKTHSIIANNQTITVNGDLSLSDGVSGHSINLSIGSGAIQVGSLTQAGGANVSISGAGNLNISGDYIYTNGTFSAGSGTVTYSGASNQTIANVVYNNLTVNKIAGIAKSEKLTSILGNLLVASGGLDNLSTLNVTGNIGINPGATFHNFYMIHLGGNWENSGNYQGEAGLSHVKFNGSGTQSISATTFGNIEIDKPVGSQAVLTGEIIINGDLNVTSGTLNLGVFKSGRNVPGGTATIADLATIIFGSNNFSNSFASYVISDLSTVILDGTVNQIIFLPGIGLGNLIIRNSGVKTLTSPLRVNGNFTIETGASFEGGSNTISINGNWVDNGTFIPSESTALFTGTSKNITGNTTFNKATIIGSYTILNNATFNGLLNITNTGSISGGNSIITTLHGDLINSGTLYALGTTTFSGNVLQTLSLINATTTVAVTVNFNGSVSPVLNSTSPPEYGFLNINNTGGIYPSVDWKILYALTVGNGASFNGGISTHNILGSVTNNGSISSSGVLNFIPISAATLNLGTNFSSTGTVNFGGTGQMTFTGNTGSLRNIIVSNVNGAGITPSSNWNVGNNFTVNSSSIFNAGSYTYSVGGNFLNNGILNSGTSTFLMNGSGPQSILSNSAFNNLSVNKASNSVTLEANASVNGVLNFIKGNVKTERFLLIQPESGSASGAAANTGWVEGNLQKAISIGSPVRNFEVGDSINYAPVSVAFASVTTAGNLIAKTFPNDHPQISSSEFRSDRTINRYWAFTNNGVVFSDAALTLNWVSSDVDEGSVATNFNVGNFDNTSWTYTPVQNQTASSIQTDEVTLLKEFAVGESCNLSTEFSFPDPLYCSVGGTIAPSISGTAGNFSSSSGLSINPTTGIIDLDASLPGNYSVRNSATSEGGCSSLSTFNISIGNNPVVLTTTTETCEGKSTGSILAQVTEGVPPYTFSLNGGEYQTSNEFIGLASGIYSLEVRGNGGCSVVSSISVSSFYPSVSIEYAERTYRTDEGIATVILTGSVGGLYTSSAGLAIDNTTGDITLSASTVGNYTVSYSIENAGGCGALQTTTNVTIETACGPDFTWLGINANWFDPGNWCGGQVPPNDGTAQDIFLPLTEIQPVINGLPVLINGNLYVEQDAHLTINSGQSFTLSNTSYAETEQGAFIKVEKDAVYRNLGHGVPTLQAHQVLAGFKGWRMLGSPVLTTYEDLLTNMVSQGFTGATYANLQPNILLWDETDMGTSLQGWRKPGNLTNSVIPGKGFYAYIFDGSPLSVGSSNYNDTLPISISATGAEVNIFTTGHDFEVSFTLRDTSLLALNDTSLVEVNVADEGFNLLANPSVSTIDFFAQNSWTKTNIDEVIYIWDPNFNEGQGAFRTFNGTTGDLNTGLIPPFQGFWIRSNASLPSLVLQNNAKSLVNSDYVGRMVSNAPMNIEMQLSGNGLKAASYISFSENGKEGADPLDAYQLESLSEDWLLFYSYGSLRTKSPLVINNLPELNDQEKTIPLHVAASKDGISPKGQYNLTWNLPANWPQEVSIVLMDHIQEKAIDMTKQESYQFNFIAPKILSDLKARKSMGFPIPKAVIFQSPYESGEANKRVDKSSPKRPFTILVGGEFRDGIIEYRPDVPKLFAPYPNPFQSQVNISFFLPVEGEAEIRITDMQGRELAKFPSKKYSTGTHELVWEAHDISAGMYIIHLLSDDNLFSQKLIKN